VLGADREGHLNRARVIATLTTMTDRTEDLSAALASLHEALESAEALDASDREELRDAMDEIRAVLDSGAGTELDSPLLDRLSALTAHFGEEHPVLTEAIGRVLHALGQLGI
jgi:hypothetical protein